MEDPIWVIKRDPGWIRRDASHEDGVTVGFLWCIWGNHKTSHMIIVWYLANHVLIICAILWRTQNAMDQTFSCYSRDFGVELYQFSDFHTSVHLHVTYAETSIYPWTTWHSRQLQQHDPLNLMITSLYPNFPNNSTASSPFLHTLLTQHVLAAWLSLQWIGWSVWTYPSPNQTSEYKSQHISANTVSCNENILAFSQNMRLASGYKRSLVLIAGSDKINLHPTIQRSWRFQLLRYHISQEICISHGTYKYTQLKGSYPLTITRSELFLAASMLLEVTETIAQNILKNYYLGNDWNEVRNLTFRGIVCFLQ